MLDSGGWNSLGPGPGPVRETRKEPEGTRNSCWRAHLQERQEGLVKLREHWSAGVRMNGGGSLAGSRIVVGGPSGSDGIARNT